MENHLYVATTLVFKNTNLKITTDGHRHLGAVIGSNRYKDEYMKDKVENWIAELKLLSKIAKVDPQSAYSCFISYRLQKQANIFYANNL